MSGLVLTVSILMALNFSAKASDLSLLCESAARDASAQTGVPFAVLQAITLAETGRNFPDSGASLHPWPWTVNQAGTGHWFDSLDQALAYASDVLDQGITNIDVGCFQLNHRWHGDGFTSLAAMFDPHQNALYAAQFIQSLYNKYGDWSIAAGAYHSNTPEYADRYRIKFDKLFAAFSGQTPPEGEIMRGIVPRQNNFQLLKVGATGIGGSLVPMIGGGQRLIGDQP